ncbi:MAG: hypothetical protein ACRD16_14660 [Thermoanaerobaculia bacterium]
MTVRLAWGESAPPIASSASWRAFVAKEMKPDLDLEVAWAKDLQQHGDRVFESGGPWNLYREGDRLSFRVFSSLLGPEPYEVARVTSDFRSGDLLLRPSAFAEGVPVDPLQFPLDELLVIHLLGTGLGVEVHACGIIENDRGVLFCGQSGDGKTTTARLWERVPGARILSDDRIILRREEGQFWIYGTPWHGEAMFAENARAPLSAVFVLDRGDTNRAVPLEPQDAIALLLARSFVPFHDAGAIGFTLRFLEELVSSVPVYRLAFVPDASATGFVRGLVR